MKETHNLDHLCGTVLFAGAAGSKVGALFLGV